MWPFFTLKQLVAVGGTINDQALETTEGRRGEQKLPEGAETRH